MKTTKLLLFPLLIAAMATMPQGAMSQVTIGADLPPQDFSVLELISNNKGLRLPQLTTAQRDALALTGNSYANGLTIFNLTTRCLEYWAVDTWKQQCGPGGPAIPAVSPSPPASCGITASNGNTTFTCKVDSLAESYQFFLNGDPQGEQTTTSITFASAQTPANVTVAYYYPPAFLKPTMLPVPGGSSWKYGTGHTSTDKAISSFSMSETPVTQAQFEFVMGINPAYFQCGGTGATSVTTRATSAFPVEQVTWYDAITYCNKLSLLEGKTPCYTVSGMSDSDWANLEYASIPKNDSQTAWLYPTCNFAANGYRLPTESEWEYAARGGTPSQSSYLSGTTATDAATLQTFAWYSANNGATGSTGPLYRGTKSVKTKLPNELGLCDMSGNVWEWCWSGYDETLPQSTPSGAVTPLGRNRFLRGGCWSYTAVGCIVSYRTFYTPSYTDYENGFRLASSSVE